MVLALQLGADTSHTTDAWCVIVRGVLEGTLAGTVTSRHAVREGPSALGGPRAGLSVTVFLDQAVGTSGPTLVPSVG